ncbi:phosphoribosylglycinamide formyltransferase [Inmirania thermothiophila]|uniref:Phosphoribosylglycinamide formyltransferase n=1 Tax=Inmirania thermothiophila TaxID=1750597 RepID=A0A3N1Y8C9_9GAMM|nr:phosphoribosylglycinamide formyltransferase [Inmirania thermothiophila]ROR35069.1 phosphoribosylglycinamide formyltransferase-1 [Inmirania thermothiophila]
MSGIGVVALISGRGSNLQAILDEAAAGRLPVQVRAVISNRPEAQGLARAQAAGIATEVVDHTAFPDRLAFEAALTEAIDRHRPDLVLLAGFMRVLSAQTVARYAGRMLNIHPSLLPAFRGLHTHRRALEAGVREHGASVHFVTADLDGGPVIVQARVPVLPGDDEARLAARVLRQEHRIYPLAVRWFAEGRIRQDGARVLLDGLPLAAPVRFEGEGP